jgi:hypothetical protein
MSFEVLTAVDMTNPIFWNMTPYIPLEVNQRFGRNNSPPYSESMSSLLGNCFMLASYFAYSSTLKTEPIFSSEMFTFNGLHVVIPQITLLFINVTIFLTWLKIKFPKNFLNYFSIQARSTYTTLI